MPNSAHTNDVTKAAQRTPPNISNPPLLFENVMPSIGHKEHKKVATAKVLYAGKSPFPSSRPRPFRDRDPIVADYFLIRSRWVFIQRDPPGYVKMIPKCNECADGE